MKTKVLKLKNRPSGIPQISDFEFGEENVPAPNPGEVLLQAIYISVDPYLRGKMSGTKEPMFELNQPIGSKLIAKVIESRNDLFKVGDYVSHYLDWKEYQISDGAGLLKINPEHASLTAYLGVLGITGLSAYLPLMDFGKPKAGETLVVSGAAGAVGSIAGQIGKITDCRVIGIVGTDEKGALVTKEFGFDGAVNYKTEKDIKAALTSLCPNGVDIYFDNVGGTISDAVLSCMNNYGRVVVCGSISNYNDTEVALSPSILPLVVYKFLSINGFLIGNFAPRFPEGLAQINAWLKDRKLKYTESILEGFERLPEAFIGLFEGKNEGKMVVKVQ